jgi:hypothetical protein
MLETRVQQLSDGEDLVWTEAIEDPSRDTFSDPRDGACRRRGLALSEGPVTGAFGTDQG